MTRLGNVSEDDLRSVLDGVEAKRPVMRLLAAIIYKQGPSVPTLADWFDVRAATIYSWFDRLETEPIHEAIEDRPRPGRPTKLAAEERAKFLEVLGNAPTTVGYEGETWTPALVQQYLADEFDVNYSIRHVRRLLVDSE